jgi:hypothetical protein
MIPQDTEHASCGDFSLFSNGFESFCLHSNHYKKQLRLCASGGRAPLVFSFRLFFGAHLRHSGGLSE